MFLSIKRAVVIEAQKKTQRKIREANQKKKSMMQVTMWKDRLHRLNNIRTIVIKECKTVRKNVATLKKQLCTAEKQQNKSLKEYTRIKGHVTQTQQIINNAMLRLNASNAWIFSNIQGLSIFHQVGEKNALLH